MLFTYFFVGIALCIPELVLVNNIPWLGRLLGKNAVVEIIFSLALGIVVGKAMGISGGVTFAIGTVFATMITKFVYSTHMLEHYSKARSRVVENREQIVASLVKLRKAAIWWFKFFTFPITVIMWVSRKIQAARGVYAGAKRRLHRA